MRKNLAQILSEARIDIKIEYERLFGLFYVQKHKSNYGQTATLRDYCASSFSIMPFRGTCLSLTDFDRTHGFSFTREPDEFGIDYLVLFCEYTYNLVAYAQTRGHFDYLVGASPFYEYIHQVEKVIDLIGYMASREEYITIFVPKFPAAISAAEISPSTVSYRIIDYNHHSMKGDLERKLSTLKMLADEIEPKRKDLRGIMGSVESELFQMMDKFIRHNNKDNPVIAAMPPQEIEVVYDDIYQLWLLAMLELDNVERKKRARELLGRING